MDNVRDYARATNERLDRIEQALNSLSPRVRVGVDPPRKERHRNHEMPPRGCAPTENHHREDARDRRSPPQVRFAAEQVEQRRREHSPTPRSPRVNRYELLFFLDLLGESHLVLTICGQGIAKECSGPGGGSQTLAVETWI